MDTYVQICTHGSIRIDMYTWIHTYRYVDFYTLMALPTDDEDIKCGAANAASSCVCVCVCVCVRERERERERERVRATYCV